MIRVALAAALALAATDATTLDPAALQRDLSTYDAFGDKITGGDGNVAARQWVSRRLAGLGYRVEQPAFDELILLPRRTTVEVDGRVVPAYPLFPPRPTAPGGIRAPLAAWDGRTADPRLGGAIALLRLPPERHSSAELSFRGLDPGAAARSGARALVVATSGPTGELLALNADATSARVAIPTLLVAGREGDRLEAAARRGAEKVVSTVARRAGPPRNVVARQAAGPRWIVVSTPISGWFAAAAERGPGVATLLAIAAEMGRLAPCDSVAIVATSGHESGYGGIEALLASGRLPPPRDTRLWVHLGAGLAAWGDEAGTRQEAARYLLVTEPVRAAAAETFRDLPGYERALVVDSSTAVGEASAIIRSGYLNVAAGVSAHLHHHARTDRADRTGGAIVAPVAGAFAGLIAARADRSCPAARR